MQQDLRRGALFAVASALMLATAATLIKAAADDVPNALIVFFRSSIGLALLLPWLAQRGWAALRTRKLGGHAWRAAFGVTSMYCYFYALAHLSLAEAVLLTYSMPLYTPFIAWAWLGERPPRGALWSALIGLGGIVLIVKPGVAGFASFAALIGACSGLAAAAAMVSIRRISDTEPATRIVFYFVLLASLISAVPMLGSWQTPPLAAWWLLLGIGASATLGQWFLTRAYAAAPVARIGPFTYSAVVFAGAFGWLVWGEGPDLGSFLGMALVAGSCLLALLPAQPRGLEPAAET